MIDLRNCSVESVSQYCDDVSDELANYCSTLSESEYLSFSLMLAQSIEQLIEIHSGLRQTTNKRVLQ